MEAAVKQTSFQFDQRAIDSAVAKIQMAATYVGKLGGFLPEDPMSLPVLRQHVTELREGLAVLTGLADELQQVQEKQATGAKRR